jgi:hypothetical protein
LLTTSETGAERDDVSQTRLGTAGGRRLPARGEATRSHPDEGGPNVPLASLILAVPCVAVVAVLCVAWGPGVLPTVVALALTPVAVFAVTLAACAVSRLFRSR